MGADIDSQAHVQTLFMCEFAYATWDRLKALTLGDTL